MEYLISEEEYAQRLKRSEKSLGIEWLRMDPICPVNGCDFEPRGIVDDYAFNDMMDQHVTLVHTDYCVICKVMVPWMDAKPR